MKSFGEECWKRPSEVCMFSEEPPLGSAQIQRSYLARQANPVHHPGVEYYVCVTDVERKN